MSSAAAVQQEMYAFGFVLNASFSMHCIYVPLIQEFDEETLMVSTVYSKVEPEAATL